MKLLSKDKTLRQILNASDLTIPSFQRSYSWGKKELMGSDRDGFVPDVLKAAYESIGRNVHKIFVGPAVFLDVTTQNANFKRKQIVDGQQRLTSLILMLCAIRQWISTDEGLSNAEFVIDGKRQDLFSWCGAQTPSVFPVSAEPRKSFNVNPRIAAGFNQLVRFSRVPPRPFNWRQVSSSAVDPPAIENLRKSYQLIFSEVKETMANYSSQESSKFTKAKLIRGLFTNVLDSVHFLAIDVDKESDALDLFINLNYGGKQLSPSDIVKAQVFQELTRTGSTTSSRLPSMNDFDARWDEASSHIAKCSGTTFTRFMRQWLLTSLPDSSKVTQETIVPKFKQLVRQKSSSEAVSKDGVLASLDELVAAAKMYRRITEVDFNSHQLKIMLSRMTYLGDAHKIYLLRLFTLAGDARLSRTRGEPELIRTVQLVENFYFRISFAGNLPQGIEDAFVKASAALGERYSKAALQRSQKVLRDHLRYSSPRKANDARLRELFKNPANGHGRIFYVFTRLENSSVKAQLDIVHPPTKLDIEHIAPVKGSKWSGDFKSQRSEREYSDHVESWGNLILLEHEINRSIGNETWSVKSRNLGRQATESCYQDSFIRSVRELARKKQWGPEQIAQRHEAIINKILKLTHV